MKQTVTRRQEAQKVGVGLALICLLAMLTGCGPTPDVNESFHAVAADLDLSCVASEPPTASVEAVTSCTSASSGDRLTLVVFESRDALEADAGIFSAPDQTSQTGARWLVTGDDPSHVETVSTKLNDLG